MRPIDLARRRGRSLVRKAKQHGREAVSTATEAAHRHPRARDAWSLASDLVGEWRHDRITGLAAEVAFFWLLAVFPAALATAAALGSLELVVGRGLAGEAEAAVLEALRDVLTDRASGTIEAVEALFDQGDAGTATIGLLTALWAASRGFLAVIRALDVVHHLEERRSYGRQRAVALGLALGSVVTAAAILAVLVLGPLLGNGRDVADAVGLGAAFATGWDLLRWPLAAAALVGWAATVLHVAPSHQTLWRRDLPGAVLAGACWAVLTVGLRLYLQLAPGANVVLGLLGGPLIVLLWLYLLAIGLLVGGELNHLLGQRRRTPGSTPDTAAPERQPTSEGNG